MYLPQMWLWKDNVGSKDADPKSYIIEGTGSGYYLIANVFANPNNAKKFVKLLNSFGLSASYFINPKNNYRYVYLKSMTLGQTLLYRIIQN